MYLQPGAVALSGRTAESLELVQGESFELLVRGVPHAATLVATFEDDGRLDDLFQRTVERDGVDGRHDGGQDLLIPLVIILNTVEAQDRGSRVN